MKCNVWAAGTCISNVQLLKVNPKIQSGIWGLIMLHQLRKILNVNDAWSLDKKPYFLLSGVVAGHKSTHKEHAYTGCPRRKGSNFGRVFLRSNYTDITQNTYTQS
jgi:hypothetical protein